MVRFKVRKFRCGPILAMHRAILVAPESAIAHDGKSRRVRVELRTILESNSGEIGDVPHIFSCVPC